MLHQDEGYYDPAFDYRCARVMVWLPLVDVDAAGGCMHFVAGGSAPTPLSRLRTERRSCCWAMIPA